MIARALALAVAPSGVRAPEDVLTTQAARFGQPGVR
jgi:hypothetical protein